MKTDTPGLGMYEYLNIDFITTSVDPIVIMNKVYTPLVATRNVKAWYLTVEQTNDGAAGETIRVDVIINGVVKTLSAVFADGAQTFLFLNLEGDLDALVGVGQLLSLDPDQSAPLETTSLQIEVSQTSVVDIVAAQIEVNLVAAMKVMST